MTTDAKESLKSSEFIKTRAGANTKTLFDSLYKDKNHYIDEAELDLIGHF